MCFVLGEMGTPLMLARAPVLSESMTAVGYDGLSKNYKVLVD